MTAVEADDKDNFIPLLACVTWVFLFVCLFMV